MSYLNYDGLAYFKSKLTNWVDQNYLSKTNTGNTTVAGNVTFTNPITSDLDGKAKKDWLGQKIDETYIKSIATNDNAGTIVYTKGNGSTNHILIDILQGATPVANGRAGLVPAPTVSEMNYFLRGDGNWAVPTDVYVNQNLIASSNNNQFPVLLSGTSGTPATKTNATVGYTNVVSVNPLTNALMASQFISKHPTYNRQSAVTSKIQYSLNFTDIVSGAGHNLGEVVGYVDTVANGGEHELGLRLFGNPNVQGTEEDYVYMGVGLSKTNVAYGHAPSTPLPSAHNEPTDIITRDWLARNGSETGLVHTSMNETIDGTKTFVKKIVANNGMNATGDIATDTLTVRQDATVGRDLAVTRNETVGGTLTTTGNISTANGNISTTNGTISGKTGSIGTGGLTVTGPSNLNGGASVTGNETVSGTLTVGGKITGNGGIDTTTLHASDDVIADDDMTVGDTLTVGTQVLKKTGNTIQEYVSYVTNQQETRNTIITNVVKPNGGLAIVDSGNDKGKIYVKAGNALEIDSSGFVNVDFSKLPPEQVKNIVDRMVDPDGAIIGSTQARIPAGETYHYYDNNGNLVSAVAPAGGIANPNYGKLTVDFSKLSPSQIEAIVLAMIAQDNQGNLIGGLATNSSGKLVVDFSQIDEDTKNEIIKDLKMQIPLAAPLHMYVDQANGNNTIIKNRGTSSLPFKTIQACVDYVTNTYSFGGFNGYIHVNAGTYEEHLVLPEFNHARGKIIITGAAQDTNSVIIHSRNGGNTVSCNGGEWDLEYFHLKHESVETVPVTSIVESCVVSSGNGVLNLQNNKYEYYYHANYTNDNHYHDFRMISADDKGSIHLKFGRVESAIIFENRTGSYTYGLCALRAGTILLCNYDGLDTNIKTVYNCFGPCTVFAYATSRGFISNVSGSTRKLTFVPDENNPVTGMRYRCNSGGAIGVARETGIEAGKIFPGSDDIEPFVDSDSFCWYKD